MERRNVKVSKRNPSRDGAGMRGAVFLALTLLCVALTVFFTGLTAFGRSRTPRREDVYFQQWEREYKSEISSFLEGQGYRNSGISLLYCEEISQEGTIREYTVWISHKKLLSLEAQEREKLFGQIARMASLEENCRLDVRLLV